MKAAAIVGWILFGIEALIIASMLIHPNIGDDAAGEGAAWGLALGLGAVLLLAGGLLFWGQREGPRPVFWSGLGILAIPLVFMAWNAGSGTFNRLDRAAGTARGRRFDDGRLTRLALAIEQDDTAAVRSVLAQGQTDFSVRNRSGRTLLGHAVEHAFAHGASPLALESVSLLLEAGARPVPDAIRAEQYPGSPDAHLLVAHVFAGNSPNTVPLLEILLRAGANPDTRSHDGQPLFYSLDATLPKLELLARHGADFTAPDPSRPDRPGWNAAMVSAQLERWDMVLFLLDHGLPADHTGEDGASLRSILADKRRNNPRDEGLARVMRRLDLQSQ